jgi:membrane-associated phospholipid phosphatase
LLNRTLKAIFERSRPLHDHGITAEGGWSFPSGHASGSMLIYGLLAYIVVRHTPARWHIPVALTSIAIITFVGSSRVLLQVHYASDVLAGYAVAVAWLAICVAALEAVRWRDSLRSSAAPRDRAQT